MIVNIRRYKKPGFVRVNDIVFCRYPVMRATKGRLGRFGIVKSTSGNIVVSSWNNLWGYNRRVKLLDYYEERSLRNSELKELKPGRYMLRKKRS